MADAAAEAEAAAAAAAPTEAQLPLSVFNGFAPLAYHAGEFWVGVCLKTKPATGVRGGETFVDKINANEHDWILSVRVTGIARSGAREKAIEALAEHFRMYVREELATVGTDDFDSVFKPENQPKTLIDKASEARPHDGAAIYSLVTSDDEGAAHVQEMLAPTQPMDEQQEAPMDVKEQLILQFAGGFRKHLEAHGLDINGYKFDPVGDVTYTTDVGVGWFLVTPALVR